MAIKAHRFTVLNVLMPFHSSLLEFCRVLYKYLGFRGEPGEISQHCLFYFKNREHSSPLCTGQESGVPLFLSFSPFSLPQSGPASQAPLKMRRSCLAILTSFSQIQMLSRQTPFMSTWNRIELMFLSKVFRWESPPLHSRRSWQHWPELGSEAFLWLYLQKDTGGKFTLQLTYIFLKMVCTESPL